MNKEKREKLINGLAKARIEHLKWKNNLEASVQDINNFLVEVDKVQPILTECSFGQWYYDAEKDLHNINFYKIVGNLHEKIHEKYFDIIAVINKKSKGFFKSKKTFMDEKQFIIDGLVLDLSNLSRELNKVLHQLEMAIHKLDCDYFED